MATSTLQKDEALQLLEQLRHSEGLISDFEIQKRAAEILDRSTLQPLSIPDFLLDKGFIETELSRMTLRLAPVIRQVFEEVHGHKPMKRLIWIDNLSDYRPTYAYFEQDRELFERAYQRLLGGERK